jgi:hypothetical protein
MSWKDILTAITSMPKLEELECGYNTFTDVSFDPDTHPRLSTPVQTLNLDSNQICGWLSVYLAFSDFPVYVISTYLMGLLSLTACHTA